jgi:hypothetical protein
MLNFLEDDRHFCYIFLWMIRILAASQTTCPKILAVVSRLSMQLEPTRFVRTYPVGMYFRFAVPKSLVFCYNVEETK